MCQLIVFTQHGEETVYSIMVCSAIFVTLFTLTSPNGMWHSIQLGPFKKFFSLLYSHNTWNLAMASQAISPPKAASCRLKECLDLQGQIFRRLTICRQGCEASCAGPQLHHVELNAEGFAVQCFLIPRFFSLYSQTVFHHRKFAAFKLCIYSVIGYKPPNKFLKKKK